MRITFFLAAPTLVMAFACGGAEVPPPDPVEVSPTPVAPAPKTAAPVDPAERLARCHEEPMGVDEYGDGETEVPVCTIREFDQMCAEDPSGCYSEGQGCLDECTKPHCPCNEACADRCQGCGETCGDDDKCIDSCFDDSEECREACYATREACELTCQSSEERCYETFGNRVDDECPRCEEIRACNYAVFLGKPARDCAKELGVTDFCVRACAAQP